MMGGAVSGHLLSPSPAGGLIFERDVTLRWDDAGALTEPESGRAAEHLLIPGLVDAHVHLPQLRVRGRYREALLPWLRTHIWPEEERFSERAYRQEVTEEFRRSLLRVGTTSALVYGSPDEDSAHAVLEDLHPLVTKGGDVLMDRNGPASLLRETTEALCDAAAHADGFAERYALTPRFAPTCSGELMRGCGELLASTSARLQTHLAENADEVAWVRELHPDLRSYTAVYAHFGLLGPRSVFGHCIHVDATDLEVLARSGSWVAHCPTSNVALSSGRMPLEQILAAGIPIALATDVGAGPDLSMLDVMRCCLEVHRGHVDLSPADVLAWATLRGAQAMGEGARRGALVAGQQADLVALRIPGGLRRGEDGEAALARVLADFAGRYEEAVAAVWIGGSPVYSSEASAEL